MGVIGQTTTEKGVKREMKPNLAPNGVFYLLSIVSFGYLSSSKIKPRISGVPDTLSVTRFTYSGHLTLGMTMDTRVVEQNMLILRARPNG